MGIQARLAAAGLTGALALAGAFTYKHEGEVPKGYLDPVGIVTACVGHTGADVALSKHYGQEQCTKWFVQDLRKAQAVVHRCAAKDLPVKTEAALISFAFNVGSGNFCTSTLVKLIKQGDYVAACQQLPRWRYAKGIVLPGLVTRRADEMQLCLEGVYGL